MASPALVMTFPHPQFIAVTEMSPTKLWVQRTWEEQGLSCEEGRGEPAVALQRVHAPLQRRQALPFKTG